MSVGKLKEESEHIYKMLSDDQRNRFEEQKMKLTIKDHGYKKGVHKFPHIYRELIHRWSLELELEEIGLNLDESHIRQYPELYNNTWQRGAVLEEM